MPRFTHPLPSIIHCRRISARPCHSSASNDSTPPPAGAGNLSHLLLGRIPRAHLLQVHARVFRFNAHQDNLIATRLIGHYPPRLALKVFRSLQEPNIFPFNSIIRVLAEEGIFLDAFHVFKRLKFCSLSPNDLTFSFLLKACSVSGDVNCIKQVHSHIVKSVFAYDSFVSNGLLTVYAKMADLVSGRQMFDEIPDRNLGCCWTSLISGYTRAGIPEEALKLFIMMLRNNLRPESDTMVSVLSACSSIDALLIEKWLNLLPRILKDFDFYSSGCDYLNIILSYLYGKCGKIGKSREAFDKISEDGKRSIFPWNVMIGAYVQNGCALEALRVFKSMMENNGCCPNHVTMVNVLSACAEIGDLDLGMWIHEYMRTRGNTALLSSNVNLATALIDMYSKCGSLDQAWKVFSQISKKDVVSFNVMIMGLAVHGKGNEALRLFDKMQEDCLRPDSGTFLGVLYACGHSGFLDRGREIFNQMTVNDSAKPGLEHYSCYIDLLARSGFIEEALGVVSSMPFEPNNFVWGALLGGCVLHNRLELARSISNMLVGVDPDNSGGYVMLSNSFAADHHWRDVSRLRDVMKEKGVAKKPGCSWLKVDGVVHEFVAGSASYLQLGIIHHIMNTLLKEMRSSTP